MTTNEYNWTLNLAEEHILKAEGADPAHIQQRKPALYAAASHALKLGMPLVKPVLAWNKYFVKSIQHQGILLEKNIRFGSPLLSNQLKNAHSLIFCVCSIGEDLEKAVREYGRSDPVLSMALDALGSAAVEQLIMEVCRNFEEKYASSTNFISQPMGPGLDGWSVAEGQPLIFRLVDTAGAGIKLSEATVMQPVKSSSFVLGISNSPFQPGSTCDYCSLRETCRYKGNHEQH